MRTLLLAFLLCVSVGIVAAAQDSPNPAIKPGALRYQRQGGQAFLLHEALKASSVK